MNIYSLCHKRSYMVNYVVRGACGVTMVLVEGIKRANWVKIPR